MVNIDGIIYLGTWDMSDTQTCDTLNDADGLYRFIARDGPLLIW